MYIHQCANYNIKKQRLYLPNLYMNHFKYFPNVLFAIINLALLITVLILFFGRTKPFFRINSLTDLLPEFYSHVSNFSISYLFLAGIGFMWLLFGIKFKFIVILTIAILLSNFIYELSLSILNTKDIVDAYYGLCGTILAFTFLLLTKKYGLKEKNLT